jgi:uncharacterized membrane protein YqaE (UPF0057 family)
MKKTAINFTLVLLTFISINVKASSSETITTKTATEKSNETINDAVVQDAMLQFKSLSRVDKKEKYAEAKKLMKEHKAQEANAEPSTNTILLAILVILLPPLAVYLHEGEFNTKFWLSLLLTLLFWLPGVIYALIVVL